MNVSYKLDFEKLRKKTQINDTQSLDLYLNNIFNDLSYRDNNERLEKIIEKITFIEYMNIPFIVGEKLFNVFDLDKNGYLKLTEFLPGIINLYSGDLERTEKIIFDLLDFDLDGIIIPEDSRLLISFVKNLAIPLKDLIKIKPRSSQIDEDNLNEINLMVENFFNKKKILTFEEFKNNIENINSDIFFLFICFLYNNKPFYESSIRVFKQSIKNNAILNSSRNSFYNNTSSDNLFKNENNTKIKSPSNIFKSFIFDFIDLDLDEIQRECEDKDENSEYEIEDYTRYTNENICNIEIPEFPTRLVLMRNKLDKDYIKRNTFNTKKLGLNSVEKTYRNFIDRIDEFNKSENDYFINDIIKNKNSNNLIMSSKNSDNNLIEKNLSINRNRHKKIYDSTKILSAGSGDENSDNQIYENKKTHHVYKKSSNSNKLNININKSHTDNNNNNNNNNNYSFKNGLAKKNATKEETLYPKIEIFSNNDVKSKYDEIKKGQISSTKLSVTSADNLQSNISHRKINNSSGNVNRYLSPDSNRLSGSCSGEILHYDIIMEGYVYKSDNTNNLRKYYLSLVGNDLFYFACSKKDDLKGIHNLSGSYIYKDSQTIKVREESPKRKNFKTESTLYFGFKLIIKKKSRIYYCSSEEDVKFWIDNIRNITKFRELSEFYDVGEELGHGKFGKVKLGISKLTKEKIAIKIVNKTNLKNSELELIKSEIEIMKFCKFKNIVKIIENFEDHENIFIILEYLSGGNLNYYLSTQKTLLTENQIKELIIQLANGINYLHHFGIIHRDLKPENIMMSDKSTQALVKIVDFGLSKVLGIFEKSNEAYGTLAYAAPEVIHKNSYNNTIDIWSLGVILFFLISGNLPFNDKNNNLHKIAVEITSGEIKFPGSIWKRTSEDAKNLVLKCMERDVKKRIDIKGFLNDKWFSTK